MTRTGAAPTELGTEKISKLLKMYAVPAIIAQTATSLYNMVDSVFIGHMPDVGASAISGLAVTFPLMNLSAAFGTLVGVGASTLISVLLGQKNYDAANKVLSNVLSLNVLIGFVFTVVCLVFLDPILMFFGASSATLPFARDYMVIILLGNIFTHLYFGFNGLIRVSGHPRIAMGLTLFTVLANTILDPVFIYGFGLGIRGAAIATVLCQMLALMYSLRFLADKRMALHFPRPIFQLDWRVARQSLAIGAGPFLMNCAACLVALFINQQLSKYSGDLAIGAYGIVNRIAMIFLMVCMGFNQGLQPIASYNYGARQYKRVKDVFLLTLKWEALVTITGFLVCELVPRLCVSIFTTDPDLLALSSRALRVQCAGLGLVAFSVVPSTLFQSLGMVRKSIFLSLSRQLIFLLPLVYLLPLWLNEVGVWISFPLSDVVSTIIATILVTPLLRKISSLRDGEDPKIIGSTIN